MSFQLETRHNFNFLADSIFSELQTGEALTLNLNAEDQTYIRFNNSKVRQATAVSQRNMTLGLQCAGRKVACSFDLTDNPNNDLMALHALLKHVRLEIRELPEDPFIVPLQNHGNSDHTYTGQLPEAEELITGIADFTEGTGFTGLFASGPQIRAIRNSAGLDHWFASESFFLDYSLFICNASGENKAVKNLYADRVWNLECFLKTLQDNKRHLDLLQRPSLSLVPGNYRVYLAPAAVAEFISMFSWGAVSFSAWKNGNCALQKLVSGAACLSEKFSLKENFNLALTPRFNSLGELPATELSVIEKGVLKNLLTSSRSAKEFSVVSNAADPSGWSGEYLRSAELEPGEMAEREVLQQLDTGLYISNLHYLNWSDMQNARITGMTRYACFWVENGAIVAPIKDLRFDDSLYQIFGSALEALTQESYLSPSIDTYYLRALGGCKTPGALIGSMRFTL